MWVKKLDHAFSHPLHITFIFSKFISSFLLVTQSPRTIPVGFDLSFKAMAMFVAGTTCVAIWIEPVAQIAAASLAETIGVVGWRRVRDAGCGADVGVA